MKSPKKVFKKQITPVVSQLLDAKVSMTHRELFHAHPLILDDTISGLQGYKRSGNFKNALLSSMDKSSKPSFI